jgi:hypothetical protein
LGDLQGQISIPDKLDIETQVFDFSGNNLQVSNYQSWSKSGLPGGIFSNKNPNLANIWMTLEWKMLVYFMPIWNMLWPFGISPFLFAVVEMISAAFAARSILHVALEY